MACSRCVINSLKSFQSHSRIFASISQRPNLKEKFDCVQRYHVRLYSVNANADTNTVTNQKEKWDLFGAVCLERRPIITQEMNEYEKKMTDFMSKLEHENSLLSDHELRYREDKLYTKRMKKEELTVEELENPRELAVEAEDKWKTELDEFHFAPRKTVADEKNDKKSTQRKLDEKLILIVKQKVGIKDVWVLPQSLWSDGESMRQTANRALDSQCGDKIKSFFIGNAPCGFYKFKYPKKVMKESIGGKIFFFKALYEKGPVNLTEEEVSDYLWVTKSELSDYLDKHYLNTISDFIVDL